MVLLHHLYPEVVQVMRAVIIEDDRLEQFMSFFTHELNRSLNAETSNDAVVKSFTTYVNKLPTGNEEGHFLALDFTSQTIKIILLTVHDTENFLKSRTFDVPSRYMVGKSRKLFDFIAKCLNDFMKDVKLKLMRIPLGVTFGFPVEQISLQDCKLLRWTKGFQCNDLINQNVFSKLKDSIRKFPNLKRIYIIGILSETTSAVLASTVEDPNCKIGMVIGYVMSCCYAEKISRITKYQAATYAEKNMYMSLDSSGFGENGELDSYRSEFDIQIDEESPNPGKLILEKMTSMIYLGEIARRALVKCIENNLILGGKVTPALQEKGSFQYTHMMQIESDPEDDHTQCRAVLNTFGYVAATDAECTQIQFICRCVSRRSVNFAAAQLAALINRINEPAVAIAVTGEMFQDYPNFEWYLTRKLNQLKKEECSFSFIKPPSNSMALGAAVLAAVFGEEVMNRDEKLRRLPGFPVARCHFRKTGRCLNPNCNAKHPCDTSGVNPLTEAMQTEIEDLTQQCFGKPTKCPNKTQQNPCAGYAQL